MKFAKTNIAVALLAAMTMSSCGDSFLDVSSKTGIL